MGKHPEKARPAPFERSQKGLLGLAIAQIGPFYTKRAGLPCSRHLEKYAFDAEGTYRKTGDERQKSCTKNQCKRSPETTANNLHYIPKQETQE